MSDWWQEVERALQERSEGAPDPWAHLADDPEGAELTAEQKAFLQQLADQPGIGRLGGDDD